MQMADLVMANWNAQPLRNAVVVCRRVRSKLPLWKNTDKIRRNSISRFITTSIIAALITLVPFTAFAAVDYGAEIVDAEGVVIVTVKATSEVTEAFVGQRLTVGDSIETGKDGAAEILFDDGNVTRIDENTLLIIEALAIQGDGSRKSILGLAFGRVKNLVSKLEHKRSRFEVHTKSAVAGVRGTPAWVVGSFEGAEHRTEVDLLGKVDDKGSIFVQGRDDAATEVVLAPQTRTVVTFGIAPIKPFALDPDRFNRMQIILPIITPPEKREEKRKEILILTEEVKEASAEEEAAPEEEEAKPEEEEAVEEEAAAEEEAVTEPEAESTTEGETATTTDDSDVVAEHLAREVSEGEIVELSESETGEETETQADTASSKTTTDTTSADASLIMGHITRKVSVGEIVNPDESETGEGTENQGDSGTSDSGTSDPPAPSTTTTTIILNLNFP